MKRLKFSIKLKVTLWFTFFNVLIVGIIFILLIRGSQSNLQGEYQRRLVKSVEEAASEIEYDDGEVEIDIDAEDYPSNVSILVYDEKGELLYGQLPNAFKEEMPFSDGDIRQVAKGDSEWYIYDTQEVKDSKTNGYLGAGTYMGEYANRKVYWIRGVLSTDSSTIAISSIVSTAFILLPLLVFLAAIGGYLVTKRAFRPIENLNREIASIDGGNDLDKRVPYKGAKDEIYTLTQNFNEMVVRLEEAFAREKQFTSDASHELRTPIAVIKAECEYGLMQKENPKEMQAALESISRQSQTMSTLVNQLLMLARADKGNVQLNKETFNLCELIEMVVEGLEEQAEERSVKLYTHMPEEVMLYADQTLVMRVLINLISNGIYYSKVKKTNKDTNPNQNGNEINQDDAYTSDVDDFQTNQENYVSIDIEETTHQVFCTVSDNGIGIPKEHQDKIWNRFYQVDPSRSKLLRGGSSGLGLAMVKWIVEVHGGKITLKSDKGKGSTFKVVLPKER